MSDSPSNFERELLAMRPRAVEPDLLNGLAQSMQHKPSRRSDWFLMSAMGSGLAAAVVIVAMLTIGMDAPAGAPAVGPIAQASPERAGDSLTMFARAENGLNDILK